MAKDEYVLFVILLLSASKDARPKIRVALALRSWSCGGSPAHPTWTQLGPKLGSICLGPIWVQIGPKLGPSWVQVGPSWVQFESKLGPVWF